MEWLLLYRTDFFTELFLLVPYLVSESFFIFVVAIGYWGVNRNLYRDLGVMICLTTMINVFIKLIFKIPRPTIEHLITVQDPFGFPSGDVMIATVFWLMLACTYKRNWLWALSFIMIGLVMCSRMYLGVHSHYDVLIGALLGIILTWFYFSIKSKGFISTRLVRLLGLLFILFISNWVFYVGYPYLLVAYGFLLGIMLGDVMKLKKPLYSGFENFRFYYIIFGLIGFFVLKFALGELKTMIDYEVYAVLSKVIMGFAFVWLLPWLMDQLLIKFKKLENQA